VAGLAAAGSTGDNGPAVGAAVSAPSGLDVTSTGNLLIADTTNNKIRRVIGPL
jgi:hypothetical protein